MRRIRLLVLSMLVASLLAVAAPAMATSTVTLDPSADWTNAGTLVDVSGTVTCSGGVGTLTIELRQGNAFGQAVRQVNCTGKSRVFADTVAGGPFQLGPAEATATLTAPSGNASTSRTVQLQ